MLQEVTWTPRVSQSMGETGLGPGAAFEVTAINLRYPGFRDVLQHQTSQAQERPSNTYTRSFWVPCDQA